MRKKTTKYSFKVQVLLSGLQHWLFVIHHILHTSRYFNNNIQLRTKATTTTLKEDWFMFPLVGLAINCNFVKGCRKFYISSGTCWLNWEWWQGFQDFWSPGFRSSFLGFWSSFLGFRSSFLGFPSQKLSLDRPLFARRMAQVWTGLESDLGTRGWWFGRAVEMRQWPSVGDTRCWFSRGGGWTLWLW